jgi:D-alanyl-D-alanine carboxypeptidase
MRLGLLSLSHRRLAATAILAMLAVAGSDWDGAQARGSRHHAKHEGKHRVVHGPNYNPPYAAIVVDANSDQVLHEADADEPRHPASVTKIMTLYLLFEQIEAGKFKLDTPLQISAHAAIQPPTKLGLKVNQTLSVEDAIKGMVTKSANDAAVVVSEAVGGTEEEFAVLMTEKAQALGMTHTTYVNASGLPAEEQITSARDQAILGRAIQERFPGFYRYFSLPSFRYHGREMPNHNGLLGQVKGMDGIKTGYTEASGYNLVASVRRDNKHIVAVVLGGKSNAARNARMRELIEQHIVHASALRSAPAVIEAAKGNTVRGNAPTEQAGAPVSAQSGPGPGETAAPALASMPTEPSQPAKAARSGKAQAGAAKAPTSEKPARRGSKPTAYHAGQTSSLSTVGRESKNAW